MTTHLAHPGYQILVCLSSDPRMQLVVEVVKVHTPTTKGDYLYVTLHTPTNEWAYYTENSYITICIVS